MVRFVAPPAQAEPSDRARISIHVDLLAYRFKRPARSDLVVYFRTAEGERRKGVV